MPANDRAAGIWRQPSSLIGVVALGTCMVVEDHAGSVNLACFYQGLRRFIDQDDYPLTIRQLAVFLTCYLLDEDHTVKRLASRLHVAKPAMSRMLDHLVEEGLVKRRTNPRDRRSVLFECTPAGWRFLQGIAQREPDFAIQRMRRSGK